MKCNNRFTAEYLRSILDYDPDTGIFRWKVFKSTRAIIGSEAGRINSVGYCQIGIDGGSYLAHRLAWLYMTGEWPELDIDHSNLIRDDNRFCNLRLATKSQNRVNARHNGKTKSGFKGVCWVRGKKKWRAVISKDRKHKHVGYFTNPEDAYAAYCEAFRAAHGEFARIA